jgi:hypothetical protein
MRKRNYLIGALAAAFTAVVPAVASGAVLTQTMEATAGPAKVSNVTYTPGSITVATHATWDAFNQGAAGADPAATHVAIDFDNDLKFTSKGVPVCQESQIAGTTTAQATAGPCAAANVGSGLAQLNGVVGPQTGTVTAFNGPPVGANPTILLHAYVPAIATTNILVGTVSPSPAGGDFGSRLDVVIKAGQLAGGKEVITDFSTTVNKTFRVLKKVKGKKKRVRVGYVSVRCKDKDKTWNYQGVFDFSHFTGGVNTGSAGSLAASTTQQCTPIIKKKKKK